MRQREKDRQQVASAETYLKKKMGKYYQFGFQKNPVGWIIQQNQTMDLWQTAEAEEKWRYFAFARSQDLRIIKRFQGTDLV